MRSRRVRIEGGESCCRCNKTMQRYKHGDDWFPKPKQKQYFSKWDNCNDCSRTQHYESFKVIL